MTFAIKMRQTYAYAKSLISLNNIFGYFMKNAFIYIVVLFFVLLINQGCQSVMGGRNDTDSELDAKMQQVLEACNTFACVNKALDKQKMLPDEAITKFESIFAPLNQYYKFKNSPYYADAAWVFPVQGYTNKAIGGNKNDKFGFVDNGCSFFDRGSNPGHPAYDIFIRDLNNDGIDDRTKKRATVLSMTGGIVIATEPNWKQGDTGRGGRYIWIYDPASKGFLYYAHSEKLFVKPGDIVKPGQPISILGRTGANAQKKRSQTHLHFSYYKYNEFSILKPTKFYNQLSAAKLVPNSKSNN